MSVRRAWIIGKVATLELPPKLKEELLTDIFRKKKRSIRLYAWNIVGGVAPEAFLTKQAAVRSWIRDVGAKLSFTGDHPEYVTLVQWDIPLKRLPQFVRKCRLQEVPVKDYTPHKCKVPIPKDTFPK